jgi:hypothetical protein
MPPANKKKIDIIIKSEKDPDAPIPALIIAEKFQSIQNLLYVIGDFIDGNKYRTGGDFPYSVKERYTLVVRNLKMGSIDADLGIADTQQGLPELDTLGEQAVALTSEVVQIAQTEEDIAARISEKISEEPRAYRVIWELDHLWPDVRTPYSVRIGLGQPKPFQLNPLRKPVIQRALRKIPEPTEKTVVGRLVQLRVDKKHECKIDTPEGEFSCRYRPEMEKTIINNIGNLISVIGKLKDNKSIEITSDSAIEKIPHFPLREVTLKDQKISLREPIDLEVQYEDDEYIVSNDVFHLLVTSQSLKDALQAVDEEFAELWKEYVESDQKTLTKDAKEFRAKMISLLDKDGDVIGYA